MSKPIIAVRGDNIKSLTVKNVGAKTWSVEDLIVSDTEVFNFSFSVDACLNWKLRREYDSSRASVEYCTDTRIVSSIR